MYLLAVAATTVAALPTLPCALGGQTYTPRRPAGASRGGATFNRRFPIGDPAMVTSNMTAAPAMHQAVTTAGGVWEGVGARDGRAARALLLHLSALDAGRWRSLNGDIGTVEFYSAHWDAAGERWIGGAQDNDV